MFKNKTILITGGTGSFGKEFLNYLLHNQKELKKILHLEYQTKKLIIVF